MDVSNCDLYELQRKRDLNNLLYIKKSENIASISNNYNPYISSNGRLIEAPAKRLIFVQRKINTYLSQILVPNWFVSCKGKSHLDNSNIHINNSNVLKIDIEKFFPRCNRCYVYNFFKKILKQTSDIAMILSDLTTINYNKLNIITTRKSQLIDFMKQNDIRSLKHLPSGSPTSQMLSFLCFYEMFSKIQCLAKENNFTMSLYVDDITFSSQNNISKKLIYEVKKILNDYGHTINLQKVKAYRENSPKSITGVIIKSDKSSTIPNKLHFKTKKQLEQHLQCKSNHRKVKLRLCILGLYKYTIQIDKKSMKKFEKAIGLIRNANPKLEENKVLSNDHLIAYVDGSFSQEKQLYSFGCVIITPKKEKIEKCGLGNKKYALESKNVAGELQGVMFAIQWAQNNGYKKILIKYDYEGIEKWVTGEWKTKKILTKEYVRFVKKHNKYVDIFFEKVIAHSGNKYNEQADKLAKYALAGRG